MLTLSYNPKKEETSEGIIRNNFIICWGS